MNEEYLYGGLVLPFIYSQPNFWMANDGKIDVAFNKPGWRDALRFTKQLIDEGLLSPLSFTQDQTQMNGLITPEPYKVGAFVRYSTSNLPANDTRRTEYVILPPLQGPAGKQWLWVPTLPSIAMIITKNCKTPESAFMLGDFMTQEDWALTGYYGQKGVDWVDADSSIRGWPGLEALGYHPILKQINQKWGMVQNTHWAQSGPIILGNRAAFPNPLSTDPTDYVIPIANILPDEVKYRTKNPVVGLIYNDQEQEVLNEYLSTIHNYVKESFARFVMGDLSIDRNWDTYIAEFNRMGLADVIRVTQSAWDRMNK
jgi:putative aldouronate transport system substrate-binding protein